ncbi:MAG: protein SanA [Bacteroidetes bacterium HGW-Bacteroidetes-4]|jgi:SanA protein|nr:MAG: protein SanA [Bacteroidetes bacterium HGW-Bacteroidetes-4]
MSQRVIAFILVLTGFLCIAFFAPDIAIKWQSKKQLFNSVDKIPHNRVGLLLGTSKYAKKGTLNLFYQYRIEAAIELYENKKIDFILISGDNGQVEYNEPRTIRDDLIAAGIPAEKIFLDYAGFRTWDSVIRAKKVFGETRLTVISQKFHNERAVFVGKRNQMQLIGYNAKDVPKHYGRKIMIREKLARIKLMLDLIFNKQPRYLGETIEIT